MSEKIDDMTNLKFIDDVLAEEKSFVDGMDERVIFPKKTDNEKMKEEIDALQQQQVDETIKEQENGN